ncbi:2-oxoacid:acceptor oxidoreductase family protein [Desulfosporosinus sp. PR]|uniref:2-oxoacid:acceptor oxidoreductase family protein n=1 Tax=Candidatus Desulfosporosinus nitrosoreducens TaxID=3401928 RepID=UPI0027F4056A|nr:2-oxoacid:acceptor oxidoreductase family protein [Desulfosporosinus sp. PR]MDQ7093501.1 2-oxoacid:acceptor oxidoreductase family protein [Desulfosporosinus sp. PR]
MSSAVSKYLFAGFGGQGVLFIGKVMAQAGMLAKRQVTWIPAYGPEMRGGTANCSVIISDKRIGSPTVGKPDIALVMNEASYHKFLASVVPGGTLYVNSSMVPELPGREDIRIVRVPVNDIAHEMGEAKVANIVMLGVIQVITPTVEDDILIKALMELAGKKPELAELNAKALKTGVEYAKNHF